MYQNNYYQPQRQQRFPVNLRGRPVSSVDEVRATSIDFDGSVFYFPDLANKRIYTKQINMDGTATILMYELKEMPVPASGNGYITREEFDKVIAHLREELYRPEPERSQEVPKFTF